MVLYILRRSRAFLTIEYAILILVFVAALIGFAVYLKRAISGGWRAEVDTTFSSGRQFEPGG